MSAYKGRSSSLSGAAKRKIRKDKEAENKNLLPTIQKLLHFGFSSNAPNRDDDGIEVLVHRDDVSVAAETDKTLETIGQQPHVCDTVNEGSKSELTIVDSTNQPDCINVDHIETTTVGTSTGSSTGIATRFPDLESSMTIPDPDSDPFPTDPALWKPISPDLKRYWLTNGPKNCQNCQCDHRASAREYNEKIR